MALLLLRPAQAGAQIFRVYNYNEDRTNITAYSITPGSSDEDRTNYFKRSFTWSRESGGDYQDKTWYASLQQRPPPDYEYIFAHIVWPDGVSGGNYWFYDGSLNAYSDSLLQLVSTNEPPPLPAGWLYASNSVDNSRTVNEATWTDIKVVNISTVLKFETQGDPSDTNSYPYEFNIAPVDEGGTNIPASLFTVNGLTPDASNNVCFVYQPCTTNDFGLATTSTIPFAAVVPGGGKLETTLSFNSSGIFHPSNNLASGPSVYLRFGTNADGSLIDATNWGPRIFYHSRVDTNRSDKIGQMVEISCSVPGTVNLTNCVFKQRREKPTMTFVFDGVNDITSTLSEPNPQDPNDPSKDDPDSALVQKGPGRLMFMLDGPGPPPDSVFSYFGDNPQRDDNFPEGIPLCEIVYRANFVTWLEIKGGHGSEPLIWHVEFHISGQGIGNVRSYPGLGRSDP